MIKTLGNILSDLRRETGVAQKDMARGIMSVSELCRVELGAQEADYILLESLFERLGKSLDKFELIVSAEEFQALVMREEIEEMLRQKSWKKVAELLEQYKKIVDFDRALHEQYVVMIEAAIHYFISGDTARYQRELEHTLELTFKGWNITLAQEEVYLCVQEVRILLMLAYIFYINSEEKQAVETAEWIEKYIEIHFVDEEEKVKIYPHCELVLAHIYAKQARIETSYQCCMKGIDCLVKNGSLALMQDFLQMKTECFSAMEEAETQMDCQKSLEAINFLYQLSGFEREEDIFIKLLRESRQRECMISNEMLKEMRAAKGYTLEALSENICAYETLLRIEKGQRTPNKKNFYKMLERMGIERKKYYGFIVADNFKLYEAVRLYNRMVSQKHRDEAAQLLEEIAVELDMDIPLNKQFVEGERVRQKTWKKEITNEQAIQELMELLQLTMPPLETDEIVYRVPFREEFNLLNQIALLRKNSGENQAALMIYREIKERYDSGKVPMTFHAVPGFVLYINYLGALEVNDNLKEAEAVGMEGIKHSLRCERGDGVGQILANMSCIYEKREEWEKEKMFLRFSYYILKLYEREHDKTLIRNVYMKKYEEELN